MNQQLLSPIVKEIPYHDPLRLYSWWAEMSWAFLFTSSQVNEATGRYSYIVLDPFKTLVSKNESLSWKTLQNEIREYAFTNHPDLPPFQGGVSGILSYELYQQFENIPLHKNDDLDFPDLALGFYDVVIAFDHFKKKAWIFSSGFPEKNIVQREQRATARLAWIEAQLMQNERRLWQTTKIPEISIQSNFSREEYLSAVEKVKNHIHSGDIFEANISQRFSTTQLNIHPFALFQRLNLINPAPFSAYLNCDGKVIASASPERFMKLTAGAVETRPIKGTRARDVSRDEEIINELHTNEKDRAENIMIVDLLRNDLSKVCENHSVEVTQLCAVESYATVHHLVSVIQGKLKPNKNWLDLIAATFPGGSITGAPKIRAMEIIQQIEKNTRGPYCGNIILAGFNGDLESSIVIRSYVIKDKQITFQTGGAITLDSDPEAEYQETLNKARALQEALLTL